jgi:multidrug efflux system outer membrane protein
MNRRQQIHGERQMGISPARFVAVFASAWSKLTLPSHSLLALCGIALAALTSCNMVPRYERPRPAINRVFADSGDRASHASAANLDTDRFIVEPRLRRLVALALESNVDLRVAMLKVEQSRAQYRIQRSSLAPSLETGGSVNVRRTESNNATTDVWSANLGSTAYELDLFGRVRSLSQQALEKYFATQEGMRTARIALVAQVAVQYFALRQYEEQLALAKKTLVTVEDSHALNKSSFDAGAITELDLRTSETQVQNAKISIVTNERQIAQAMNQLVSLIGRPLPDNLPSPRGLSDGNLLASVAAGLPAEMLELRPDILEAEHTLKAANASIGAARAAFFPSIRLTGSLESGSNSLSNLLGSGTGVWNFTPKITVPIFTGGSNRANLDSAKIAARIEVANYQKAIQNAFREVSDALVARRTYAEEVVLREGLVKAQRARLDLATARFRQGVDTYLNVLSAQQDLFTTEQNLITTRFNVLDSQVAIYKALGGGWK